MPYCRRILTECCKFEKEGKMSFSIFIEWTNETDKQYVAVFLLYNTTYHYQALFQISES